MRECRLFLCALAVVFASGTAFSADKPTALSQPAASEVLSPQIRKALADFSSDDFKTRESALKNLQAAFGQQMRALINSEDPEVQSRVVSLLQFNEGLTRWVMDTMKLPVEQRKTQLDFGLRPDVLPMVALVFSADPDKRAEGVKGLAKLEDAQVTGLLARALEDPERIVYVAAMEALWDRKPTQAIVDTLWQRAIESGFGGYRPQPMVNNAPQAVMFRGKAVPNTGYYGMQPKYYGADAGIAGDVLVNFKTPMVARKLEDYIPTLETMATNNPWMWNNNNEQMRNIFKLVEAYKSKGVIDAFYKIATSPARQKFPQNFGNGQCFWSSRTGPLVLVVTATDQKPEDYKLKKNQMMGGSWVFDKEEEEEEAVKKLQEWMKTNGEKLAKDLAAPATRPAASQPAKTEPPADPNAPRVIIQGGNGLMIQGQVIIKGGGPGVIHVEAVAEPAEAPKPVKAK